MIELIFSEMILFASNASNKGHENYIKCKHILLLNF